MLNKSLLASKRWYASSYNRKRVQWKETTSMRRVGNFHLIARFHKIQCAKYHYGLYNVPASFDRSLERDFYYTFGVQSLLPKLIRWQVRFVIITYSIKMSVKHIYSISIHELEICILMLNTQFFRNVIIGKVNI